MRGLLMAKKKTLFDKMVGDIKKKNPYAFLLTEDDNPYEVKNWTDTGCYGLNAILSDGDINKGIPDGKRVMISGESSTAKSLFTAFIIAAYMKRNKKSYAVFFESEGSTVTGMAETVGIPKDRMIVIPVATIEECRNNMVTMVDQIIEAQNEENNEDKFIFCIDSLGMLSTNKEVGDISEGIDKKDMTRAGLIKGFARIISLKLSLAQIPLIVVNHTYATFDKYDPQKASGGSGPVYMSDVHIMLFKTKEKEGKKQVGVLIRAKLVKSRFMIENKDVRILLHFKKGLYKFSNLVQWAQEFGVFVKEKISYVMPDGRKKKMKEVRENASKFMIGKNLEATRKAVMDEFGFGSLDDNNEDFADDIEDEEFDPEAEDSSSEDVSKPEEA